MAAQRSQFQSPSVFPVVFRRRQQIEAGVEPKAVDAQDKLAVVEEEVEGNTTLESNCLFLAQVLSGFA